MQGSRSKWRDLHESRLIEILASLQDPTQMTSLLWWVLIPPILFIADFHCYSLLGMGEMPVLILCPIIQKAISSLRAAFSSYSSSINTPLTRAIICLKNEGTQEQISKSGDYSKDNPRPARFVLRCSQFQKSTKLNWSPLQEQLRERIFYS